MLLTESKEVTVLAVSGADEMQSELRRVLFERFGEDTYDPKRFRVVAIMAADREPGDAAKAVEDVVMGNADAARVFDAVGEAFGIRADGSHVSLDIHIDNDRVSIESWAPPRERTERFIGTLKNFEPAVVGEVGPATGDTVATDLKPVMQQLDFAVGQKVFVVYGDQQAGPAKITAYSVYEKTDTQYLAEWITPDGAPKSVWAVASSLRPAQVTA